MKKLINYDTVTEAVVDLKKRGYIEDFNILSLASSLQFFGFKIALPPEDFRIDETYRFEGNTDPGDQMIVYAISSIDKKVKGILVNGYGPSADDLSFQIVERLMVPASN